MEGVLMLPLPDRLGDLLDRTFETINHILVWVATR